MNLTAIDESTAANHDPQEEEPNQIDQLRHAIQVQLRTVNGHAELLLQESQPEILSAVRQDLETICQTSTDLFLIADNILTARGDALASGRFVVARTLRHELVTQLSVIVDSTRLLARENVGEQWPHWRTKLEKINTAAMEVFNLIDAFENDPQDRSPSRVNRSHASAQPLQAELNELPVGLPRGHVLVVDDTPSNLHLLSRQLNIIGCRVSVAKGATEALDLLTHQNFDLVLLDLLMPDISGEDVLDRIRSHPRLRQLPVIMTSALDDFNSVVRCIEKGAEDFLPKPVNTTWLRARICAALERKRLQDLEKQYRFRLQKEKQRVEELLRAILPEQAVRELQLSNRVQPRRHERVAVMFCDVCNFTNFSEHHEPEQVVEYLQELCERFEQICDKHGLEKIKTIGDSFMAVAGLSDTERSPVERAVHCAQEMILTAPTLSAQWRVRAAVNVGPVVSGVVGHSKFAFDVWGDTVNLAARIEAQAGPGEVWLSQSVVEAFEEDLEAYPCGFVELKGKGSTPLYRMDGIGN